MRKVFNTTGSCNPARHYMVDTEKRFKAVERLIDTGSYFTINRARQYGKTTMLQTIRRRLSDQYLIIKTCFEGLGDDSFESIPRFIATFCRLMVGYLQDIGVDEQIWKEFDHDDLTSFDELSEAITKFCDAYHKLVVLLIDEVDKSSDNQLFLNFIGMLRNKYLERNDGLGNTFHSVVLAGVYDIKNLKLKLRPDAEKKYNSSWNIAADFNVDMTFHPEEIAQMLTDYENDVHTGMDIKAISEEIYKSYIKENQRGKTMIHNLIFEEAMFVYFSNKMMREQGDRITPFVSSYIQNGRLNMEYVLERFAQLMHEEYRERTESFLEKEGRLLFLTFLKPIINGIGFYYVEPQTRDNRRMDLVVNYDRQEFIVELKIWRGDKYEQTGREQLSEYLAIRGMDEGYLLTYDFSKNKQNVEPLWHEVNGKRIFEAVV